VDYCSNIFQHIVTFESILGFNVLVLQGVSQN